MSTLAEFPPPGRQPTIGERNSKLVSTDESCVITDYRRIDLTDTTSHTKSLACLETTCKAAFVNEEQHLIEKLQEEWDKNGFSGVFKELQSSKNVHTSIKSLSLALYNGLSLLSSWREKIMPKKTFHHTSNNSPLLACHPHIPRMAIVLKDQTIKVMTVNKIDEQDVLLKDKRIKKVTCLAWRPKSSLSLAVGSSQGILVWLLDPNITTVRSGSNMTRFLQSRDMSSDVNSISWSADGKLLACSSVNSSCFWIWNIVSELNTPLHRVGSAITFVNWSPCGQKLLSVNQSQTFRVWETMQWTCEKWADLNGTCSNACWSSCGSYLLFTVACEPIIYYVHFDSKSNIDVGSNGVALKCADLSACVDTEDENEIGGLITDMVWDPTNSRLAVTCQGPSSNQPYVVLFHTRIAPLLQLIPCGFIRGEDCEFPLKIDFLHGYDKGALMAIYWSSETISLIPLLYNQNLSSSPRYHLAHINELNTTTTNNLGDYSTVENETVIYSQFHD